MCVSSLSTAGNARNSLCIETTKLVCVCLQKKCRSSLFSLSLCVSSINHYKKCIYSFKQKRRLIQIEIEGVV